MLPMKKQTPSLGAMDKAVRELNAYVESLTEPDQRLRSLLDRLLEAASTLTDEQEELAGKLNEQMQIGDVGELAGEVNHKFNNFLNSLLLKITLLETELPDVTAGKFSEIKAHARRMAELIRQVHQYRPRPTAGQIHDLNTLLKRTLQEQKDVGAVHVECCPEPALVTGAALDFERLCSFLIGKRPGNPTKGALSFRTEVAADRVHLTFEDPRLRAPADQIPDVFDGEVPEVDIARKLELATCKALTRRLQGKIEAAPRPNHGAVIHIDLPRAKPK